MSLARAARDGIVGAVGVTLPLACDTGRARARRGMSIIEVMVVIAILLAMAAIMVPAIGSFLQLEQRRTAQELATSYGYLHDEAVMQNVTYRIVYHLDENYYEIESGEPDALIFDDPEKRAQWEHDRDQQMRLLSDEQRAQQQQDDAGSWMSFGAAPASAPSEGGNLPIPRSDVRARRDLPRGTVFGGVYTPQYGEIVKPDATRAEREGPRVVYSHIFANGFAEQTLIQLVDQDDPTSGYTIAIDPLSGRVRMVGEVQGVDDFWHDLPDEAPELQ